MQPCFVFLILSIFNLVTAISKFKDYSDLRARDDHMKTHLGSRNVHDKVRTAQYHGSLQSMPSFKDWITPVSQTGRSSSPIGQGNAVIPSIAGHQTITTATNRGSTSSNGNLGSSSSSSGSTNKHRKRSFYAYENPMDLY